MPHTPIIIKMSPWSDNHEPHVPMCLRIKSMSSPYEVNYGVSFEDFLNRVGIYLFVMLALGMIIILEFIILK